MLKMNQKSNDIEFQKYFPTHMQELNYISQLWFLMYGLQELITTSEQ